MKYFIDSEFVEDGLTIDLISIGIVREDGKKYYAISDDFDAEKASDWVRKNVFPKLDLKGFDDAWKSKKEIREEVLEFMKDDKEIEVWADYASYDWVVFCQLFGRMIDLPKGFPMFCHDIQQYRGNIDVSKIESQVPHNALSDAIECKRRWEYITEKLCK
jgi:hypothetical protein